MALTNANTVHLLELPVHLGQRLATSESTFSDERDDVDSVFTLRNRWQKSLLQRPNRFPILNAVLVRTGFVAGDNQTPAMESL
jgi:hypothetical protein